MPIKACSCARACLAGLASMVLACCSSGPMNVEETYYLKVTNGQDNGYIRINVSAGTHLSEARYNSGWYLAEAVDALFGNISEDPDGATGAARDAMRERLIEALKAGQEAYLRLALDENTTDKQLTAALHRWKRVRFAPGFDSPSIRDSILVEYNAAQDIETVRAGKKLVFFLSANPDQIIQSISKFANDAETKAAIQRFSEVIIQRAMAEVDERKARAEVTAQLDQVLAARITSVADKLENTASPPARDTAVGELESLRALANSLQNTEGAP